MRTVWICGRFCRTGTAADLRDVMAQAILKKPMEHCFERPKDMTEHHLMSGIGG